MVQDEAVPFSLWWREQLHSIWMKHMSQCWTSYLGCGKCQRTVGMCTWDDIGQSYHCIASALEEIGHSWLQQMYVAVIWRLSPTPHTSTLEAPLVRVSSLDECPFDQGWWWDHQGYCVLQQDSESVTLLKFLWSQLLPHTACGAFPSNKAHSCQQRFGPPRIQLNKITIHWKKATVFRGNNTISSCYCINWSACLSESSDVRLYYCIQLSQSKWSSLFMEGIQSTTGIEIPGYFCFCSGVSFLE